MSKYTLDEIFSEGVEVYDRFNTVVNRPQIFREELERRGYLNQTHSVLSIGGGAAELELKLIRDRKIKMGYIDPSRVYVAQLKNYVSRNHLENDFLEIVESTHKANPSFAFNNGVITDVNGLDSSRASSYGCLDRAGG